jgi:Bor protein
MVWKEESMNRVLLTLMVVPVLALSSGCHHAVIETMAKPSTVTIERPFAAGWLLGLVPPKTVETASRCPSGVAKVETQITFTNGLVRCLTLGIYTPMWIKVTCAEPQAPEKRGQPADIIVGKGASGTRIIEALEEAADKALHLRRPVLVQF